MNDEQKQPVNRLEILKEMRAKGELGKAGMVGIDGYRRVPLNKLVEDPKNERKRFDDLAGMIESVRRFGILEPIVVKPIENGRYQIIIGHRRYRAAKTVGIEMLEIIVRENDDETRTRIKSIISNVQRESVNPIDMAEAIKSLLDDNQVATQRELAQMIGKPEAWVSDMLRVLTLPAELQTKLRLTEVPLNYDAVSRVARFKEQNAQHELIEMLLQGASQRQIRDEIAARGSRSNRARLPGIPSKPKHVISTSHRSVVVIQSLNSSLSRERILASLQDALKKARREREDQN